MNEHDALATLNSLLADIVNAELDLAFYREMSKSYSVIEDARLCNIIKNGEERLEDFVKSLLSKEQ